MRRATVLFTGLFLLAATALLQADEPKGDGWMTNHIALPWIIGTGKQQVAEFETLRAEVISGRLKVRWSPSTTNWSAVTAWISPEAPEHWASRDWRPRAMMKGDLGWETSVPVEDTDVAVAYFVSAKASPGPTNFSPVRLVDPRAAGMEVPTASFWPFVEGFEEGLWSWQPVGDADFGLSPEPHEGRFAAKLSIPVQGRSATVLTTRLRGARTRAAGALGLQLWLRTDAANAIVRLTVTANAGTTYQTTATFSPDFPVTKKWTKAEVLFDRLKGFPLGELDQVAVEFISQGPASLWVDDLELIGAWTK